MKQYEPKEKADPTLSHLMVPLRTQAPPLLCLPPLASGYSPMLMVSGLQQGDLLNTEEHNMKSPFLALFLQPQAFFWFSGSLFSSFACCLHEYKLYAYTALFDILLLKIKWT